MALDKRLEEWKQRLLDDKFVLVGSIYRHHLHTGQIEVLAELLYSFFKSHQREKALMSWVIGEEVRGAATAGTIFREENLLTKILFKNCFGPQGMDFLRSTVKVLIAEMKEIDYSIEIDPLKAGPNVDIEANSKVLVDKCEQFLSLLINSVHLLPAMVRSAFCLLKAEVEARFKDIADRIVGSVLFLRFICPAIVSPHRYNLDREQPQGFYLRSLVLVSKVLTSLANGVPFMSNKDSRSKILDAFMKKNTPLLGQLTEEIIKTTRIEQSLSSVNLEERPVCPELDKCQVTDPDHWIKFHHTMPRNDISHSATETLDGKEKKNLSDTEEKQSEALQKLLDYLSKSLFESEGSFLPDDLALSVQSCSEQIKQMNIAVESKSWKLTKKRKGVNCYIGKHSERTHLLLIKVTAVVPASMQDVHNFLCQSHSKLDVKTPLNLGQPDEDAAENQKPSTNGHSGGSLLKRASSHGIAEMKQLLNKKHSIEASTSFRIRRKDSSSSDSRNEVSVEGSDSLSSTKDAEEQKEDKTNKRAIKKKVRTGQFNKFPFALEALEQLDSCRTDYRSVCEFPEPIKSRDFCCTRYSFVSKEENSCYSCFYHTVRKDCPPSSQYIRGELYPSGHIVRSLPDEHADSVDASKLVFLIQLDPKGEDPIDDSIASKLAVECGKIARNVAKYFAHLNSEKTLVSSQSLTEQQAQPRGRSSTIGGLVRALPALNTAKLRRDKSVSSSPRRLRTESLMLSPGRTQSDLEKNSKEKQINCPDLNQVGGSSPDTPRINRWSSRYSINLSNWIKGMGSDTIVSPTSSLDTDATTEDTSVCSSEGEGELDGNLKSPQTKSRSYPLLDTKLDSRVSNGISTSLPSESVALARQLNATTQLHPFRSISFDESRKNRTHKDKHSDSTSNNCNKERKEKKNKGDKPKTEKKKKKKKKKEVHTTADATTTTIQTEE